ncbi:galactolipase DONGLE, chloroplastic [Ipomoea triloba]|uniref:galactolipase DONGLE, chloroplastic n=1 Tax=Ipomoea triloba TaxID=35885 RepID=UPI00125DC862|nr:galactolipase DONGLE, chloroplastic [Ipomoea triloba]
MATATATAAPSLHASPSAPPANDIISRNYNSNNNNNNVNSYVDRGSGRRRLSEVWREVHGSNNWEGLMDPLDPNLRLEIIRYGEFVTACYKAFDLDPNSSRYLHCKYGKASMLREVGLGGSGYEVTKYIYALPDIGISLSGGGGADVARWIGYVAVCTDEEEVKRLGRRDVLVTFRGTVTHSEWIANLMSSLTPAKLNPFEPADDVKVQAGFLSLYTSSSQAESRLGLGSCRQQLLSEISRIINEYKGEELSITLAGHSMGSSLATLLAYDITELGMNGEIPVTVFSFAGPRVGNSGFKDRCEGLGVRVLRIVNVNDPITKLPGVFFNENFRVFGMERLSCYVHVGVELLLDFFKVHDPSCVHDLESHINLLRCPKTLGLFRRRDGGDFDFVRLAKEMFRSGEKNIAGFQWEWTKAALWLYLLLTVINLDSYTLLNM